MKPADDELIAHIKDSLTEYEEVYVPGAWERFEKKEGKGRRLLWLAGLSSAAAALFIGFVLFYNSNDETPAKKTSQQAKTSVEKKQAPSPVPSSPAVVPAADRSITKNLTTAVSENEAVVLQRKNNNVANNPLIVARQQPLVVKHPVVPAEAGVVSDIGSVVISGKNDPAILAPDSALLVKDPAKISKPKSFREFLEAEVKAGTQLAEAKPLVKKHDKWEMGVVVAPSIGNSKKLNMGYGLSMAYALSNKVSISSGISYSEMGASKDLTKGTENRLSSPETTAMVTESKSLQSIDANLVGLDIPVEVKYYFTKKLYTNFGLSAFAVLSQKQSNNYLQGTVENRSDNLNQAGFNAVFSQKNVSEDVPSGEIRSGKYLGFYNISFGYKQKVSDNRAFSVEPFMKLPMKEFTKENLYLIGAGVRLRFDF